MKEDPDGSLAAADHLADLARAELVDEAEEDHLPALVREGADRAPDPARSSRRVTMA